MVVGRLHRFSFSSRNSACARASRNEGVNETGEMSREETGKVRVLRSQLKESEGKVQCERAGPRSTAAATEVVGVDRSVCIDGVCWREGLRRHLGNKKKGYGHMAPRRTTHKHRSF
jgi:hypothetical protein